MAPSPRCSPRSHRRRTTSWCSRRSGSFPRRLDFKGGRACTVAPLNAAAPFTNDRYDEEPYAEAQGAELSRVHISRTFTGDLEGESTAEIMIAKSEGGGGYVG